MGMRAMRKNGRMWLGFILWVLFSHDASGAQNPNGASGADFNRDIRPLFARHCTACHGGVKEAGKVSFIYRDKALAAGKSGERAIVPGRPEASELMRRVTSKDPDELMPKPSHGPRLTDGEVGTLRQWISEGARWSEHWSFVPPKEPPQPVTKNKGWIKTSSDSFILARLEAEGLGPSDEAAPAEWLRRVSLDLTGLPPSPSEYEDFLAAPARGVDSAKEQVVDRLLSSPHFGERWASMWLDLARYSDTFGFEKDPPRNIWPWRDWVVRAFNADMRFDAFTIAQLAGDLLPSPASDDLLATAFHRNTQNNSEGGTDDEEYRTAAVLDRVNTTWTAWQATTFGCTQCHAHPYDPFPQRDYYRFAAFFDNTEDCDQNDDFPRHRFIHDAGRREAATQLQREEKRERKLLNDEGLALSKLVTNWSPLIPIELSASGGTLAATNQGIVHAGGTLPVDVRYTLVMPAEEGMTALRLDIFPESDFPKRAPERGQILSKMKVLLKTPGTSNQVIQIKEVIADYLAGPFDPHGVIENKGGFGGYPVMTHPRQAFFVLERPLSASKGSRLEILLEHGIASNSGFQGCALRHFAFSSTKDSRFTEFVNTPTRVGGWSRLASLRTKLKDVGGASTSVPFMVERMEEARRETRLFIRGNRMTRDELVEPGIPEVTQPPPSGGRLNRLDMARWLVGDRNPLAARVLANRLWAEMFGRGIVETLEDFGTSGAKPTHPELLDHLALRLRDGLMWSMKSFLRELALSAAYGQSSRAGARLFETDPGNALVARGPRVRLTAEMIRDQALAVSGLLSRKTGGAPVFPPQPEGVWNAVYSGAKWETSKGEDRFRRAIYTYNRRTSGYPMFLTFDAPTRDVCTARRQLSNTPLQALTVLNDPAFIEIAAAFGERMTAGGGSPRQIIERGWRVLSLERPAEEILDSLTRLYEGAVQDYQKDRAAAARLGGTPEKAAMVLVANTLLNLDSTLTR